MTNETLKKRFNIPDIIIENATNIMMQGKNGVFYNLTRNIKNEFVAKRFVYNDKFKEGKDGKSIQVN
mgnify:CR=1 FL=1|tara:strand:- start:835 stop:1035 length:201 start_codon:yes stop_codon:yes gene_type:complete